MYAKILISIMLLVNWLSLTPSSANETSKSADQLRSTAYHVTEYKKALPPIGYVGFCARNPRDCKQSRVRPVKLRLTQQQWSLLFQVNTYVNGKIMPVSDAELFGEPEYWTYPVDAGDCEDYVLLKKHQLEKLGFAASALLITVVLDENGGGHAVLMIETSEGDYVLDNRRNEIRLWSNINYKFLKRQSRKDVRTWVSLTADKTDAEEFPAGNASRR